MTLRGEKCQMLNRNGKIGIRARPIRLLISLWLVIFGLTQQPKAFGKKLAQAHGHCEVFSQIQHFWRVLAKSNFWRPIGMKRESLLSRQGRRSMVKSVLTSSLRDDSGHESCKNVQVQTKGRLRLVSILIYLPEKSLFFALLKLRRLMVQLLFCSI